ncbi:MAG: flagellar export chaperone FlgN [Sedimentisphaerales bacterium]|jgi:hypothetical protein|nr:flagellar export chaperone FlgN [Sedimentisphaerales bacterium]HNY79305.1 flagellar export chaperone FlgN [Sedimentisphaerales bacterium]HOC64497.1 flagellar export chaperone FlgN [Sedimentisphaerales bacterium]HOH63360.1 flagellar export chaperone FlgN [Sedimentisphaerales bacterium]HPY48544.1 flagellar export chaperone FlgN [Sedimentisphaerales bacterium]
MISSLVETKVDALLTALDEDIRNSESTLSRLDVLRSLIIKRDDVALEQLLHDLRHEAESRAVGDQRREGIRKELATELGCDIRGLTLSTLKRMLSGPRRQAVADRQVRLQSLIAQLKREYALTTALVADCARFNRTLMHVLFGLNVKGKTTYNAQGAVSRQADANLVNLHY